MVISVLTCTRSPSTATLGDRVHVMRFMFLGMLGAYLLGNVYIFIRGWQGVNALLPLFHCSRAAALGIKILFTIVVWGAAASLFIALFSRDAALPDWLQGGMYNLGSIWLVFTLYMVLALVAVDLLRIFAWRQPLKESGFAAAFAFTFMLLLYGYINYRNPKVEEVDIALGCGEISAEGKNLSGREDSLSGKDSLGRNDSFGKADSPEKKHVRIVAISDVHLGFATQKKHLQRYVEKINSLSPDIILIAGDLIDNSIKPVEQQRMQEELGMLRAPGGIYMVPGNHEYISGIADVEAFLQKTPIMLLRDSVVMHPSGIAIAGRDDRTNRERLSVEELLHNINVTDLTYKDASGLADNNTVGGAPGTAKKFDRPVILLDHQPYEIALKDSLGIDVQLSGHTHQGQVWPMSILVDRMYEQSHGWRKWNNSHVIVSSGLSLWGPPFRIGTDSDLWVINLTF